MGFFNLSKSHKKVVPAPVVEPEPFIEVPMEVMDASFPRAAGRYCEACEVNGSHHTDRHNMFAKAALSR